MTSGDDLPRRVFIALNAVLLRDRAPYHSDHSGLATIVFVPLQARGLLDAFMCVFVVLHP